MHNISYVWKMLYYLKIFILGERDGVPKTLTAQSARRKTGVHKGSALVSPVRRLLRTTIGEQADWHIIPPRWQT